MSQRRTHVYLLNTALLAAHQVDSGVQHEWELFGLPGNEGSFVLSSLLLFLLVLFGYSKVAENSSIGPAFSLSLAITGIASFVLHYYQVAQGRPEYSSPMSGLVLWLGLLVSFYQGWLTMREMGSELRSHH